RHRPRRPPAGPGGTDRRAARPTRRRNRRRRAGSSPRRRARTYVRTPAYRARKLVAVQIHLRPDARALARRTLDAEAPSKRRDPIGETEQARAGADVGASDAVVRDLDSYDALDRRETHVDARCLRVPHD